MRSVQRLVAHRSESGPSSPEASSRALVSQYVPKTWKLYAFVSIVGLALFTIALSGYPNLMDNERRIAGYVLDVVQNGHWAIQMDATGEVASKPPLLTWIAALATLAFGKINLAAIYLPSALATIGVALLILAAGKRHFGWIAGFLGALAYLLSPVGDMQIRSVRYDGLLALPVLLGAIAAHEAWSRGSGWTRFWLAGAMGTLVKGPIAPVLAAGGLLAHFWEKRSGKQSSLRGSHWLGILCFLVIVGGWFLLAYREMGQPVVEKLLGRELAAHATGAGRNESMLLGFYVPLWSFISGFAPWSILTVIGLWRVWKHPDPDPERRRFERFLFWWFCAGMFLFMLAAHQRGRLIQPLIPAAALLAGRELGGLLRLWSTCRLIRAVAISTVTFLAVSLLYHHVFMGYTADVQKTLGAREIARRIRSQWGEAFPLVHVDSPFALQFYLNTIRPVVSAERAARLLRDDFPTYVAISSQEKLLAHLQPNPPALHEIIPWRGAGKAGVRIVSNHPDSQVTGRVATLLGPLLVRLDGAQIAHANDKEIVLRQLRTSMAFSVKNESESSQTLRVRLIRSASEVPELLTDQILAPDETWSFKP